MAVKENQPLSASAAPPARYSAFIRPRSLHPAVDVVPASEVLDDIEASSPGERLDQCFTTLSLTVAAPLGA